MKRLRTPLFLLGLVLSACGTTIGDPCTTNAECGNQICLNQEYAPGGYCSRQCTLADTRSCPNGTICVRDGQARNLPACFLVCKTQSDCRVGYVCKVTHESLDTVCVGPEGS